jgi:hypothetical protein
MEEAARRLVVEHYDWAAVAQDFEDALARAARRDDRAVPARGEQEDGHRLPREPRENVAVPLSRSI